MFADDRILIHHTARRCKWESGRLARLQIRILLVWQRHGCSFGHFLVVLIEQLLVDCDLWWGKSGSRNEVKLRVTDQFASQPEERLLEVIIGLGTNVVVLKVLFAVECDGLCLDLSLLDIDFVSAKDNWDILTDTDQIAYLKRVSWKMMVDSRAQEILRCQLGTFL